MSKKTVSADKAKAKPAAKDGKVKAKPAAAPKPKKAADEE
jgi:hypothetical protein